MLGKKMKARRFEKSLPTVSQSTIDEECKFVAHEMNDYLLLATNELRKLTDQRHRTSITTWKQLQDQFAHLPERDAEALRCILFRDILHVLALHQSFCRSHRSESSPRIVPDPVAQERHEQFREWLFG